MVSQVLRPIHPGEILLEELLVPLGLSQCRLAKGISVSPLSRRHDAAGAADRCSALGVDLRPTAWKAGA